MDNCGLGAREAKLVGAVIPPTLKSSRTAVQQPTNESLLLPLGARPSQRTHRRDAKVVRCATICTLFPARLNVPPLQRVNKNGNRISESKTARWLPWSKNPGFKSLLSPAFSSSHFCWSKCHRSRCCASRRRSNRSLKIMLHHSSTRLACVHVELPLLASTRCARKYPVVNLLWTAVEAEGPTWSLDLGVATGC